MKLLTGYLRLMRLPNVVTAISDVLAGVAIAGSLAAATFGMTGQTSLGKLLLEQASFRAFYPILMLVISTVCLYGGGVVFNDVFDARLDKKERPERPIPSGLISVQSAAIFGTILLLLGITAAMYHQPDELFNKSALIAALIAAASLVYDKWGKHSGFLGPINMGICRGLNLLLGMSLVTYAIPFYWNIAFVPLIYIAAITMISRGEVHGGRKSTLYAARVFYIIVLLVLLYVAFRNGNMPEVVPFLGIFAFLILPPLQKAIANPQGPLIGKAVKSGVIAIIAMNACWAAAFNDIYLAILIILLLPLTLLLARLFAVT